MAAANGRNLGIVRSVLSWTATGNGDAIRETLNTHEGADFILLS